MFVDFDLKQWETIEYRERWLVRQTQSLGFESKLFVLTDQKHIHYSDDGEIIFFPVDRLWVANINIHLKRCCKRYKKKIQI